MKPKLFIYLFVFVFLTSFILAAQPTVNVPQTAPTQNLVLQYPKISAYNYEKVLNFHMHVFNSTGFLLTNATNGGIKFCTIHFYNSSNAHIFKGNLTFDGIEWEHDFPAYTITQPGEYPYTIWCQMRNDANGAGFASGTVFFTNNGVSIATPQFILPVALLIITIIIIYIVIAMTWEFNLTGKEKINVIKLGIVWLVTWLVPLLAQLAYVFSTYGNLSLLAQTLIETMYTVSVWIAILLSAYFGIFIFYNTLIYLSEVFKK